MAEYSVDLLDQYNIEDSKVRKSLLGRLRDFSNIPSEEISDDTLSSWLWSGAKVFIPTIQSWDDIGSLIEHGVMLWAAISVADYRMQSSAKYFPIKSRVGETDPSKRVESNLKIKQALMTQFDQFLATSGISLGEQITVGEFVRRDIVHDIMVPIDTQSAPIPVKLQILSQTTDSVTLVWNESKINDFAAYTVYYDTKPNLEDLTRMSSSTMRGVREDVQEALTIYDQTDRAMKVEEMSAGTYFFVVVVVDINGKVALSNEISVTVG